MYAHFHVTAALPEGVTSSDMRAYILEEVQANVGQKHPDDPLFNLDKTSVRVLNLGLSHGRNYDEGAYSTMSPQAKEDDHRRVYRENEGLKDILRWLVTQSPTIPADLYDELMVKVYAALAEGRADEDHPS